MRRLLSSMMLEVGAGSLDFFIVFFTLFSLTGVDGLTSGATFEVIGLNCCS